MAGETMDFHAEGITKSFATNTVLAGIDLAIAPGEVVGLVGENGAGKSTLVRIITGAMRADAGEISIDGEPVRFRDTHDAMRYGIHAIYQELRHNLFPQLTVAENMFMLDERRRFGRLLVSHRGMAKAAGDLLKRVGMTIDPTAKVGDLTVSEQQMVQVATAVAKQLSLLILDEPTAALDKREAERLFDQVHRLKDDGVSILYVSHRLEEVFALTDRIVVLRDGKVSIQGPTSGFTQDGVVRAMVGRRIDSFYPKDHNVRDEVELAVDGAGHQGSFTGVSFQVHSGEILGIGGALGCGRGDLLRALYGEVPLDSGTVSLGGKGIDITGPRQAIRAGIGYISGDRQRDGLCLQQSITDNVTLATASRFATVGGLMRTGQELAAATSVMEQLNIRATSANDSVGELSGGNQQKVLFGKWLVASPTVLLLEEPTRGVDVGAKVEIYRYLNRLTAEGLAVVLVSSDLPELCEMSDRVLVMREGVVAATLAGSDVTQENVLRHALGSAA
jgi:ABC-type sugar transport system ATPase subunit